MVNGFRYYRALESVSIASALSTAPLPFTHARSESINADSLNSNFLQLGRRSDGRPQRAVHPMRLHVNTVTRTTLVGLEPATFRSLVDCWSHALPVVPPTHLRNSSPPDNSHYELHRVPKFRRGHRQPGRGEYRCDIKIAVLISKSLYLPHVQYIEPQISSSYGKPS